MRKSANNASEQGGWCLMEKMILLQIVFEEMNATFLMGDGSLIKSKCLDKT
jgi:hypothetical protein